MSSFLWLTNISYEEDCVRVFVIDVNSGTYYTDDIRDDIKVYCTKSLTRRLALLYA